MKVILRHVLISIAFMPLTSFGHHSFFGRFDAETIMEIEGVVTEVLWRNPHTTVLIEVTEPDRTRTTWVYEALSPNRLLRAGIQPDDIKVGDRVVAAGWPPLTEKKEMFATNLLLPSGQELLLVGQAEPRWTGNVLGDTSYDSQTEGDASMPELGIFRVWSHTNVIPFLFPGTTDPTVKADVYPLTQAARDAVVAFDGSIQNPTQNCAPKGMPLIMEQPYPIEFVDEGEIFSLRIEEYDLVRTIYMNAALPPVDQPRSLLGYSIGRWDESDLVVTTTRLDYPWFNQLGIPQSEDSVVVERFSPMTDGSRLDYTLTVTDPVYFTEPVTLEKYWLFLPDQEILPYDCATGE